MTEFMFSGTLSASKSLMNRALIIKSFSPELELLGQSDCDDVVLMQNGIVSMLRGEPIECGHAGTVLRFLALRCSRIPGRHVLRGSERLFSRPQSELLPILGQLGSEVVFGKNQMEIISKGWRMVVDGLQINATRSSQFASAFVLSAWNYDLPLHFNIARNMVSEGYFRMTLAQVRSLGMKIEDNGSEFFIPAKQCVNASQYRVEIDMSSAFAVAAMAVVGGRAIIKNFPKVSLQPDAIFVKILRDMGADIFLQSDQLEVRLSAPLRGIRVDLRNSPDLFPILAVLCATANSKSDISGIGHLKYKESSRLEKTQELLIAMGAKMDASDNQATIYPAERVVSADCDYVLDVDQDHRMAMAATIARQAGYRVRPSDLSVVSKSFPEFKKLALPEVTRGAEL